MAAGNESSSRAHQMALFEQEDRKRNAGLIHLVSREAFIAEALTHRCVTLREKKKTISFYLLPRFYPLRCPKLNLVLFVCTPSSSHFVSAVTFRVTMNSAY